MPDAVLYTADTAGNICTYDSAVSLGSGRLTHNPITVGKQVLVTVRVS